MYKRKRPKQVRDRCYTLFYEENSDWYGTGNW